MVIGSIPHILKLQFHLLPIRDWNKNLIKIGLTSKKLQFHLLPIRDWNSAVAFACFPTAELQFHLLPIRDWNWSDIPYLASSDRRLQFHLLPIRDWNYPNRGIKIKSQIAISLTPY